MDKRREIIRLQLQPDRSQSSNSRPSLRAKAHGRLGGVPSEFAGWNCTVVARKVQPPNRPLPYSIDDGIGYDRLKTSRWVSRDYARPRCATHADQYVLYVVRYAAAALAANPEKSAFACD